MTAPPGWIGALVQMALPRPCTTRPPGIPADEWIAAHAIAVAHTYDAYTAVMVTTGDQCEGESHFGGYCGWCQAQGSEGDIANAQRHAAYAARFALDAGDDPYPRGPLTCDLPDAAPPPVVPTLPPMTMAHLLGPLAKPPEPPPEVTSRMVLSAAAGLIVSFAAWRLFR